MTSGLVELEGVTVRYAIGPAWRRQVKEAVRGVTLEVDEGETVGLVGESGSGKTTIGRLCVGLLQPTTGAVRFRGERVVLGRRLRGQFQVVLQHPEWSLNPHLPVATSVAEPLAITGLVARRDRDRLVEDMLERVGLDRAFARRYPHELSGGQRQRVAIARALITKPAFVVFDEAVSALDVSVQAQVLNLVKDLQADYRFGALFISHDLAVVRYVADRIVVLYAGEVMESGPAARFYGVPLHPYSRALGSGASAHALRLNPTTDVDDLGCPLSPRCPLVVERCRVERPVLRSIQNTQVACHRAGEV